MNKKLYVGNLNYDTTEESLKETFQEAGTVESCDIITDRRTGKSKGFGFVEMASEQEAEEAMDKFNDTEIDGRTVKVDEAKPKQ